MTTPDGLDTDRVCKARLTRPGWPKQSRKEIKLPQKVGQLERMFRNEEGHLANTDENQKVILKMVRDDSNFIGTSKNKYTELDWYSQILENGKQLWASVRNGIVQDCGINNTPRGFNKDTGLCRNPHQEQKK